MQDEIGKLVYESSTLVEDSRRNNKLVGILRLEESSTILEVLKKMTELKCNNTLRVASRVLNDNKFVKEFFLYGLNIADASTIEFWLKFALPKLGTHAVIKILKEKEVEKNGTITKAIYFLPSLVKPEERPLLEELSIK